MLEVLEPTPTATAFAATAEPGWEILAPGIDMRIGLMWISGVNGPVELTIVRVDPAFNDIRVHYALDDPASVSGWNDRTQATVLINGAFFEPRTTVLGLLVENGVAYGEPFLDHGGMMSITDDSVEVRSLALTPISAGEQFDYAIQGRPMLLNPGGFPVDFDLSPEASRRTVIAQDREGRILFMVNDYGAVSLYTLQEWLLTAPELNINAAFNLDGGGSTGMALNTPQRSFLIDSWWGVATAVAVYPKE